MANTADIRQAGVPAARRSHLAQYLYLAYALLIVYASLHPFTGWRDQGLSAFAFLSAPWPRYVTEFDLLGNVLGYLPYGFLCVLALHGVASRPASFAAAAVSGLALSIGLEAAQTFLPARIASNLDVVCNVFGAAAGAIGGHWAAHWLLEEGPLRRLRAWAFLPGPATDLGLVLLGLWLFAQLNPATLLFGTGSLRELLGLVDPSAPGRAARSPEEFVSVEALTAAVNLAAAGLFASALVQPGRPTRRILVALALVALAVRTSAFSIVLAPANWLDWATPGGVQGLVGGLFIALASARLPRGIRLMAAAVLVMVGAVLVNVSPANPYLAATQALWKQGHFLNFNGLTRLVSTLWPYVVLPYLVSLAARRNERGD